jgi:hypothetical protein
MSDRENDQTLETAKSGEAARYVSISLMGIRARFVRRYYYLTCFGLVVLLSVVALSVGGQYEQLAALVVMAVAIVAAALIFFIDNPRILTWQVWLTEALGAKEMYRLITLDTRLDTWALIGLWGGVVGSVQGLLKATTATTWFKDNEKIAAAAMNSGFMVLAISYTSILGHSASFVVFLLGTLSIFAYVLFVRLVMKL